MFDGKMLRGATGTPIRRIDRANSSFALADPDPLTFANFTTKSFVASIRFIPNSLHEGSPGSPGHLQLHYARLPVGRRAREALPSLAGVGHSKRELLHVPG